MKNSNRLVKKKNKDYYNSMKDMPVIKSYDYNPKKDPKVNDLVGFYNEDGIPTYGIVCELVLDDVIGEDYLDEEEIEIGDVIWETLTYKIISSNGLVYIDYDEVSLEQKY